MPIRSLPNTTYTGSMTLTRINATEMQITGTLGAASHTVTDAFDSASYRHARVLGQFEYVRIVEHSRRQPNNGIDFSNVTSRVYSGSRTGNG